MSLSLTDIENWDSHAVDAVARAAADADAATRAIADRLGATVGSLPWDGIAAGAARIDMRHIHEQLYRHADECRSVARAASSYAPKVARLKQDWHAVLDEAASWGIRVDIGSGAVTWPVLAGESPAHQAAMQCTAEHVVSRLVAIRQRAGRIDAELAEAIDASEAATGVEPLSFGFGGDPPQSPGSEPSEDQRNNQVAAFHEVFGRDPVSAADWETAAALDPHSYQPKNRGVPPRIVVGQITPVPGQGVVRTNLFIPGDTAWTPFGDNLGDGRLFDPSAGPEDSRVTVYVDYDNGIVLTRQNPSVMANAEVKTGAPDVRVSQNPHGAVLVEYRAADPFSPGGEGLAKSTPWNVNGRLVIKPTDGGPIVGGQVSDFPAVEIYSDRNGTTTAMGTIMPKNIGPEGPLVGLPFSQQIGPGLMGEFPDDVYLSPPGVPFHPLPGSPGQQLPIPPASPTLPIVIPYPSVELGPVADQVKVPVGR